MGRMSKYVDMVGQSRLLAPNLKVMTIRLFTGNLHKGNTIARAVIKKHILALRWMNPNAAIYIREEKGQGLPEIEYTLWTEEGQKKFEIAGKYTPEEVVGKLMMAARDPYLDDESAAATSTPASTATVETIGTSLDISHSATGVAKRAFSTMSGSGTVLSGERLA